MLSILEIVLFLVQHGGFCQGGELFDHDHPVQRHFESALFYSWGQ